MRRMLRGFEMERLRLNGHAAFCCEAGAVAIGGLRIPAIVKSQIAASWG